MQVNVTYHCLSTEQGVNTYLAIAHPAKSFKMNE